MLLTKYLPRASHVFDKMLWNGVSLLHINSEILPPYSSFLRAIYSGFASIALGYGIARLHGVKDILRLPGITDYLDLWNELSDLFIRSRRRYRA
jgi:hypothetical protein